jgi:hypothetical protein
LRQSVSTTEPLSALAIRAPSDAGRLPSPLDIASAQIGTLLTQAPFFPDLMRARSEKHLADLLYVKWAEHRSYEQEGYDGGKEIREITLHVGRAIDSYVRVLGLDQKEFQRGSVPTLNTALKLQPVPILVRDREESLKVLLEFGQCLRLEPLSHMRAYQSAWVFQSFVERCPDGAKNVLREEFFRGFKIEAEALAKLAPNSHWYGEKNMRSYTAAHLFRIAETFTEEQEENIRLRIKEVQSFRTYGDSQFITQSLLRLLALVGDNADDYRHLFKECGETMAQDAWNWEGGGETALALQKFAHAFWALEWAGEPGRDASIKLQNALKKHLSTGQKRAEWAKDLQTDADGAIITEVIRRSIGELPHPKGHLNISLFDADLLSQAAPASLPSSTAIRWTGEVRRATLDDNT